MDYLGVRRAWKKVSKKQPVILRLQAVVYSFFILIRSSYKSLSSCRRQGFGRLFIPQRLNGIGCCGFNGLIANCQQGNGYSR